MINCNIYFDFCLNLSRVWRFNPHDVIGTRRKQNRQARLPPNRVPLFLLLLVELILIYLRITANHPASRTFLLLTRVCTTWQNLYFSSSFKKTKAGSARQGSANMKVIKTQREPYTVCNCYRSCAMNFIKIETIETATKMSETTSKNTQNGWTNLKEIETDRNCGSP